MRESIKEEMQACIARFNPTDRYRLNELWIELDDKEPYKKEVAESMLLERRLNDGERADYLSFLGEIENSSRLIPFFYHGELRQICLKDLVPLLKTPYWTKWIECLERLTDRDPVFSAMCLDSYKMLVISYYPYLEENFGKSPMDFLPEWVENWRRTYA
ncbi:hypothetical protein D3H64_09385 [Atopobacter sp. AH10]|uniref:hypothetical protein n=1 Tax=Atopobacter sp. AH10 TaxID=2315861 RepID=UPI000EF236D0|nr:hypothetical protein [Atopobacter sp. AH10]RLK62470.1 hypothetical protein D3H64_09385 [Atopobacter sp. AH10]